ncbi:Cytochrome c [Oryzisolibacter propanilivorax]|uniref:Cytochrome c n=1 Tax=Oryzisolibacter propanilivorax TaxID=1527607 RepID=A0A1G9P7E6_9BURK|nr:cytochrome c [Oryzisolibacter propanilivorax]SDL94431.1 Cytochrome c [Oryzisolibacter propanilivorax]
MHAWFTPCLALAPALSIGLAMAQPREPAPARASIERGRQLLAQYQCGSCHTIPGVPAARGEVAQTLRSWGRRNYIAGRLPNRGDLLARWIVDPPALVPGTAMPRMGVSPEQARAMAAYLLSLQ